MTTARAHAVGPSVEEAAATVGGNFERHGRMVYGICRAMLRDAHEAEDATQQAFLAAHKALLAGTAVRDPGAWLASIARNECRARIAEGMRRPLPATGEDLDALPAAGDEIRRRSQLDELRSALAELPERQREAVVLRYLYGLRYDEVATALGLSRPATEALLFRARRAMRVRLRPAVGAALVVPSVVREELALALPGFGGGSAAGTAALGVTGGILAKLSAGSAGAKVATAAVAVSTVSAVGAVPAERFDRSLKEPVIVESSIGPDDQPVQSSSDGREEDERRDDSSHSGSSGRSGASDDEAEDRSGPNRGEDSVRDGDGAKGTSGSGSAGDGVRDDDAEPSRSGPSSGSSSSGSRESADPDPEDAASEIESSSSGEGSGRGEEGRTEGGSGGSSGSGSGPDGEGERSEPED